MRRSRAAAAMAAGVAAAVVITGCGSSGDGHHPAAESTPQPVGSSAQSVAPPLAVPTLSARDVADHGLPAKVGAGKLSRPTIKRLIQFFEDKVSAAYAGGNADSLTHYLAGPMLSGNRATIKLLAAQHKRNVFKIRVQKVVPELNQAHQVIARMAGDMTLDYFYDPRTKKVLNNGLPGPSQVQFVIFLNQNPATGIWYWTGEQAAAGSGATGGTATG